MLTINLLPQTERKATLSTVEQLHRTPLVWVVVSGMISLLVLLWIPITLRRQELQKLDAQIQALAPKKAEVDRLQQFTRQLRAQETAFRELRQGQYHWSKRLNTLSNLTPDGVWFTELAMDAQRGLVIQGAALGQGGAEMVGIGRLVQDLKADPDFSAAVNDIQIESIKRTQDKEIEIVQFTLTCTLSKETPAS